MDDKDLLESALSDDPVVDTEVEVQAEAQVEEQGQARDEQGRFAAKIEPEAAPAVAEPAKTEQANEANVPSWRLREERERADAADRRFNEAQANWQRQFSELQSRLPKQEPTPVPDVFENPNGFLEHGVKQAVDPINSQISQMREFYSRKDAIREHGQEKVTAAYNAISQGMQQRDPETMAVYHRAMQSMDPFGEIVSWHQQKTVFSQIGSDPNAWFEKELERRMADPGFSAAQLQKIQQATQASSGGKAPSNITRLPPSLNRVSSAQAASDDDGDMSDASLFANAMR